MTGDASPGMTAGAVRLLPFGAATRTLLPRSVGCQTGGDERVGAGAGQVFRMAARDDVRWPGRIIASGTGAAELRADETLRAGYLGL